MQMITRDNMVPIATVVTPHRHTSPLFNRLMYGRDTKPHPAFKDRPNPNICEEWARSTRVPHNMLGRANYIWRTKHPKEFYGGSYKAMNPRTHFDQSFRLVISTSIASHLLKAHKRVCTLQPTRINPDEDTATTVTASTTSSISTNTDSKYFSQTTPNAVAKPQNLSQDTLGEHFSPPRGQISHVRHHNRVTHSMDVPMTAGNN